jgi:hypothetical protein
VLVGTKGSWRRVADGLGRADAVGGYSAVYKALGMTDDFEARVVSRHDAERVKT